MPVNREELYKCTIDDYIKKTFIDFESDNEMDYIDRSLKYFFKV